MSDRFWHRSFSKKIGTFDAIELGKSAGTDWTQLNMFVGGPDRENAASVVSMQFRSEESLRDLRYAIDRLLDDDGPCA